MTPNKNYSKKTYMGAICGIFGAKFDFEQKQKRSASNNGLVTPGTPGIRYPGRISYLSKVERKRLRQL
jgi:hypothetical protein